MISANVVGLGIALLVAALLAFPCAGLLRKHPGIFYAVASVATLAYLFFVSTSNAGPTGIPGILSVFQKGYLATILLYIVMFTGVLDENSALRLRLQPVRGELSILSFIFILGHLYTYLPGYLPRMGSLLSENSTIALSLAVALLLTVLFFVLSAMSVRSVRRSMNPKLWKAVQRFAYAMMGLLVLHVGLMLGKSAFGGGFTRSTGVFAAYMGIVALYAVLRTRKALHDKNVAHRKHEVSAAKEPVPA